MAPKPIRWGIIGCGDVCEVKSGPAFYRCEGSQLRIVMRRDERLAQHFARRHGVPSATNSAREVIEHPEVDAVYIATPPGSHAQYALAVAAAGKPCYVEKPMARSAAECEQMLRAFSDRSLPLFVAYYRRALPRFEAVRTLLQSGELGTLRSIDHCYQGQRSRSGQPAAGPPDAGWRERVAVSGAGLFLDLGSHVLDLIDHWLGPLSHVSGCASRLTPSDAPDAVEDTVVASFTTESGALGTLRYQFHTESSGDRLHIVGDRGSLCCSVFGTEPVEWHGPSGVQHLEADTPPHVHQPLVQSVVDQLRGKAGVACPSTGESAARTSRVTDQILSGYYGDRRADFWAHPKAWPARKKTL